LFFFFFFFFFFSSKNWLIKIQHLLQMKL